MIAIEGLADGRGVLGEIEGLLDGSGVVGAAVEIMIIVEGAMVVSVFPTHRPDRTSAMSTYRTSADS